MSPFIKAILDRAVKPFADAEIASLKTNRAANIAYLEAEVAAGGNAADAVVAKLVGGVKANPFITMAVNLLAPSLVTELDAAVGVGAQDIPALYDAGVAFLEKEDAYL